MAREPVRPARREPRKDRPPRHVQPRNHDTYKLRQKPGGTVVCADCGAVHQAGRWTWGAPPAEARSDRCPACRRISDRYPAGTLSLRGSVLKHRDEVLGMIRNVEEREKSEHPLERLMDIERKDDCLLVSTTGLHLARCLASALERRFKGHIRIAYGEEENHVCVEWVD